ncbi:CRTAC1 family protein [Salinibacter sp. 10B]|uniref:CRTAC1 family protein n=1 Tax=Salinibacter sp. 10B TaxID=1923971 RepID=UPI000CF38F9A|nr:CRTAC1 family protein [Salinibacter sp. 10B]
MMSLLRRPWTRSMGLLVLVLGLGACQSDRVPTPGAGAYQEAVTAFYTGVTALQVGENFRARNHLETAAKKAPGEPAVWANRGLIDLRTRKYETAAQYLERARGLAPDHGPIQYLSGLLAREQGEYEQSIAYLRRAAELDSTNRRAVYTLAQVIEQRGGEGATTEALQLMDRLLRLEPGNVAVLVERARLAAKGGHTEGLREAVEQLADHASAWPESVQQSFRDVQDVMGTPSKAASTVAFLKNDLKRVEAYQADRQVVQPPGEQLGSVLARPLRLQTPDSRPAPADTGLAFTPDTVTTAGTWDWVAPMTLSDGVPPDVMMANRQTLRVETGLGRTETMSFPGGGTAPSGHAVAALDLDYDFRTDLAAAGAGGLQVYRQAADTSFRALPSEAVPASVRNGAYAGIWTADLDMDGDLDLVAARAQGAPVVLRNNGDATFSTRNYFDDVQALRAFVWGDLDGDGPPEAAMLDAEGQLHVYDNRRSATPRFQRRTVPDTLAPAHALAVTDVNGDATLDLLLLHENGAIRRLTDAGSSGWTSEVLFQWDEAPADARLLTGDFDNNGGVDVLASGPEGGQVWLRDSTQTFTALSTPIEHPAFGAADVRGAGRLDLVGLGPDGTPLRLTNEGTANYQSQRIQPRAARTQGDRRINPFGLGGEIELRSGLLYQKRVIDDPTVHFGIGRRTGADVARITWPNGTVQAEFDLVSTQTARARQRLKGSCPWVYTYDGEGMRFATDFLWRTALGLRINAQGKAQVIHSEDRIFIPGEHVARRNGMYDIRITGELWESHFFDRVELMAVDHPADTPVRIDERFHMPPPDQTLVPLSDPQPVANATDQAGRDVTDRVQAKDGRYLDTFELGPFQGRAAAHSVTVDLGEDVPTDGPLWLVADGWVYPTDTSINLAISQGDHDAPRSLTLEVPDGTGGWTVAKSDIGFPAGKSKTMLIDLSDVGGADGPHRVRLRTNMEIYWDRLAWATGRPDTEVQTHVMTPDSARLRYRGFSKVVQTERRKPTVPVYDSIASTAPIWRDLEGYHTRFGDVRPLLTQTDDRYVIMNAGDEMVLRFEAPPPPPEGWTRDFVLIGDGWVKDGDYNTGYSKTVRPLPYHGMEDYSTPPGPLEEDPAYRMHPQDWQTYHTRYVTPRGFHQALTVGRER